MLSASRQEQLTPILEALRQIPGVVDVYDDDFDSTSINVFLRLGAEKNSYRAGSPIYGFASPLRSIKAAIKRVCREAGVGMNFLDWPAMKYSYSYYRGQRETYKDGYDQDDIKIEVFIYEREKAEARPRREVQGVLAL
jgi:hypothetical protein